MSKRRELKVADLVRSQDLARDVERSIKSRLIWEDTLALPDLIWLPTDYNKAFRAARSHFLNVIAKAAKRPATGYIRVFCVFFVNWGDERLKDFRSVSRKAIEDVLETGFGRAGAAWLDPFLLRIYLTQRLQGEQYKAPDLLEHDVPSTIGERLEAKFLKAQAPILKELDEWLASLNGTRIPCSESEERIAEIRRLLARAGRELIFRNQPVSIHGRTPDDQDNATIELKTLRQVPQRIVYARVAFPSVQTGPALP